MEGYLEEMLLVCQRSEEYNQFMLGKMAADHGLSGLSMGMSDDFETAVMLGATHVRVGSALFGARAA